VGVPCSNSINQQLILTRRAARGRPRACRSTEGGVVTATAADIQSAHIALEPPFGMAAFGVQLVCVDRRQGDARADTAPIACPARSGRVAPLWSFLQASVGLVRAKVRGLKMQPRKYPVPVLTEAGRGFALDSAVGCLSTVPSFWCR
jgi:hypothetical protein